MSSYYGRGVQGATGPAGRAATIAVGTVTTGAPTDPASVHNSGDGSQAVFDFVIPKGNTGDTGPQPIFGSPVATTLPAGSPASASISGSGTAESPYILTLGLPQGAQGVQGDQPVFGSPLVATLEPGQSATVSISGAGTAADPYVLSFGIPKGAKGDTGATGEPGALTATRDPTSADGTAVGQVFTNTVTNAMFVLTALAPNTWTKVCYGATSIVATDDGYAKGSQVNALLAQAIARVVKSGPNQLISGSGVDVTNFTLNVSYSGYAIVDFILAASGPQDSHQKISVNVVKTTGGNRLYYGVGTCYLPATNDTFYWHQVVIVPVQAGDTLSLATGTWWSGGYTIVSQYTEMGAVVVGAYASGTRAIAPDWGSPTFIDGPPEKRESESR